ncbi:NAD-dependent epimerase/dehydratase family protein [Flavobacteriales bacterium]|nr:NAD-dependent epimerase/dehydratase family protein [Flavobacteriales bacterium]
MRILLTGGAGFIGCNLSFYLKKKHPEYELVVIDNLSRVGSETNVEKLREIGAEFIEGDVRRMSDLNSILRIDIVIHCASNPSVLAGLSSSSSEVIENNLIGSINVYEFASKNKADVLLFSTNRVYNQDNLNELKFQVGDSRFILDNRQVFAGVSELGVDERFPVDQSKTFYGATKFCSEVLLKEYGKYQGVRHVINRFGVISGPGQFGNQNQGIVSHWLKCHLRKKNLQYFGYGGSGKQVRDVIHVIDVCEVIDKQIHQIASVNGETFNVGGGLSNSFSLLELTFLCQNVTGNRVEIAGSLDMRVGDVPLYYTNNAKISDSLNWSPKRTLKDVLIDLLKRESE